MIGDLLQIPKHSLCPLLQPARAAVAHHWVSLLKLAPSYSRSPSSLQTSVPHWPLTQPWHMGLEFGAPPRGFPSPVQRALCLITILLSPVRSREASWGFVESWVLLLLGWKITGMEATERSADWTATLLLSAQFDQFHQPHLPTNRAHYCTCAVAKKSRAKTERMRTWSGYSKQNTPVGCARVLFSSG